MQTNKTPDPMDMNHPAGTYAFTEDVPIDAAFYERLRAGIGDELPKGLITHLVVERPEGGLRYIDVWESKQDWDRFEQERVHPVVHQMLSQIFGERLPPEPERIPISVVHAWHP